MAICCSDCIRIISCDTNKEIETYENIFPMNSPQDYAERYLCELKGNKLLAYSKNMKTIKMENIVMIVRVEAKVIIQKCLK